MCGGEDEKSQQLMRDIVNAGHTIGIHSISHDYEKIYSSVESYLDDFNETYTCIYNATGVKPQIFRFPGGSINNYNRFTYMQIIAEMTRRGFVYSTGTSAARTLSAALTGQASTTTSCRESKAILRTER